VLASVLEKEPHATSRSSRPDSPPDIPTSLSRRVSGKEIAFACPAFRGLSRTARVWVATNVAFLIVTRFTGVGFVRRLLGQRAAAAVETRVGSWLRRERGIARNPVDEQLGCAGAMEELAHAG
jgi:hypothetical protein